MPVKEEAISTPEDQISGAGTAVHARKPGGMVRLLGLSGIAMALVLPIGIYPRFVQSQELEHGHSQVMARLPVVSTAAPQAAPTQRTLTLPGSVEALQETGIYARADGYIKERFVDIGDRVHPGQTLASIETPEVDESVKEARALVLTQIATRAQMQANLDKARADLDSTVAELAQARATLIQRQSNESFAGVSDIRWKSLAQQGAVSSHDSDEKENAFKISKAETQAARDKIRSLQSQVVAARARVEAEAANLNVSDANIDAARARENRTGTQQAFNKIVAPFAGVITERNIDSGMLITAGSENSKQALYRVARVDTVKVFVDVPQYASSEIRVGQKVGVTLKEFPGRTFDGQVQRTSVALDSTARTLKTEIHIANKDLLLSPGMYVEAHFNLPRSGRAYLVPTNAVLTRADGPQVLVAQASPNEPATVGKIDYRQVQLGDDLGRQIEIVAGLKSGERVVVNPSDALRSGDRVQIDQDGK